MRHSRAWCETGDCVSREGRGAPGLEAGAAGQRQSPHGLPFSAVQTQLSLAFLKTEELFGNLKLCFLILFC